MKRAAIVALLFLSIGAIVGYVAYPVFHDAGASLGAACDIPGATRDVVACTLSPEQIDHLTARIAPAVVERLANSGLANIAPDANVAAKVNAAEEKSRREQAAAFAQAARLVDQMIEARAVTPQGRMRAHELLQQTGQADRIFEIEARISAAINRGDITPAQAGMVPQPGP